MICWERERRTCFLEAAAGHGCAKGAPLASLQHPGASPPLPPPSLLAPAQLFQVGLTWSPCSLVPCPALSCPAQPANNSLQHHPPTAGHTLASPSPESYGNRFPPQGTLDATLEPSRGCRKPSKDAVQSNLRKDSAA